jgi:hypothetical protein
VAAYVIVNTTNSGPNYTTSRDATTRRALAIALYTGLGTAATTPTVPRRGSDRPYLRLRSGVNQRATYCWPDSVYEPQVLGGPDVLGELCRLADAGRVDAGLLPEAAADLPLDDPLNDYVEAHVHGGLLLARDVEALVLDPSDYEAHIHVLGRVDCPVETHPGYRTSAESIDPRYRGDVPVTLARQLGCEITPARLGEAYRSGEVDAQALKWLWHCLARFGRQW